MMWNLNKYGKNVAVLTEKGQRITYSQLFSETEKLAAKINDRCLAFILCSNNIGSIIGYVSFINYNIVPLLLDANLERQLLWALIKNYKPDYLWIPADMANEFEFNTVYSSCGYSLLKTSYSKVFSLYEELALLLTTSGSTGSPKLVRQSYANIRSNTKSIVEYLQLDESERPITTLPMSYTYGLSIINTHLYVGASIILTQKTLIQREFWKQFKDFEATSFGGVPYTYEMLEKLRFFKMKLLSLRTMTQAGGKLSSELHKKFAMYAKENNKRFIVMYGQTEATARMAYLPHDMSLEKFGSMGIPIPGGRFSLIDIHGNEITEPELVGELVYEGPNVTLGYAECGSDLAKGDENDGILYTGDMAKRDADGFYYIVGRKKRFLKLFGSRINLDEVEQMVKSEFPAVDCACAGVDDSMYIFVTDESIKPHVLKFLTKKTGLNQIAFHIKTIKTVPKNDAGKTLYVELEKYYD